MWLDCFTIVWFVGFGRVWCDLFVLVGWRFYCGFRVIAMLVASYAGVLWLGC